MLQDRNRSMSIFFEMLVLINSCELPCQGKSIARLFALCRYATHQVIKELVSLSALFAIALIQILYEANSK